MGGAGAVFPGLLDLVAALHAGLVIGGGEPPASDDDGAGDHVPVRHSQDPLLVCTARRRQPPPGPDAPTYAYRSIVEQGRDRCRRDTRRGQSCLARP